MRKVRSQVLFLFVAVSWLAACAGMPGARGQPTLFHPPTRSAPLAVEPTVTPTGSPLGNASHPTVTPTCIDGLSYLKDLTIPDGTVVHPGDTLDKRWLVENSGTCNWDSRYRLKLVSGPNMGAKEEQALYPARGGTQLTIALQFLAPAEAGSFRSAWQAYNPQGEAFGDPFYIEVAVQP